MLAALGTAVVGWTAGCTGSGGGGTPTGTPTPPDRDFPYTARSPSANVNPRDLTLDNRTPRERQADVTVTDIDAERTVLERSVTLEGDGEYTFDDVIGKVGTYGIRFSLAAGTRKRYEWPIDESNGDARITIAEGERPTEPVLWFTITNL